MPVDILIYLTPQQQKDLVLGEATRHAAIKYAQLNHPDPVALIICLDQLAQHLWNLNQGYAGNLVQTIADALTQEYNLQNPTNPLGPWRNRRGTATHAADRPARPTPHRRPGDPHPTNTPSS